MMETMSNEVAVISEFTKIDEATFNGCSSGNTELDFLFLRIFSISGVNGFVVRRVPRRSRFFPFWSVFRTGTFLDFSDGFYLAHVIWNWDLLVYVEIFLVFYPWFEGISDWIYF